MQTQRQKPLALQPKNLPDSVTDLLYNRFNSLMRACDATDQAVNEMVCNFCGSQMVGNTRCSGCGAASQRLLTRKTQLEAAASQTPVKKSASSGYLIHFALALVAGLLVTYYTTKDTQLTPSASRLDTNSTASELRYKQLFNVNEIRQKLRTIDHTAFSYVGVNHSSSANGRVELALRPTDQKLVLVLSSYEPVHWHVTNPKNVHLAAIVYGSAAPGSRINGDLPAHTLLIPADKRIGNLTAPRSCDCRTARVYDCNGTTASATIGEINALGSGKLIGLSNQLSASSLKVPQMTLNQYLVKEKIQQSTDTLKKQQCLN